MDSVRFGRALGKGARAAARGLYEAVDAAAAPNPHPKTATSQQSAPAAQSTRQATAASARDVVNAVSQGVAAYGQQKQAVKREAGRLGRSMLAPFARAGRALWLEVTGTFFAIFAMFFINSTWKLHGALHRTADNAEMHQHLMYAVGATLVFSYFAVSSFVRAHRINSGRG